MNETNGSPSPLPRSPLPRSPLPRSPLPRSLRILVVEDEPSIRRGLCDVLTFRGYRVESVDNGRGALEQLLSTSFDLVLLDVMLPELDGFSTCRELRASGNELPVLPSVRFEPDALRQILFNLVDNALKYSREASERRISVRLEPKLPDRVLLFVRDRGPGVQQEHLRAIFQPFFRTERELTRKTQGTGIGLSLVQRLVERMGGAVHGVNADPGFEIRVELVAS